jgi:hypothetical protein
MSGDHECVVIRDPLIPSHTVHPIISLIQLLSIDVVAAVTLLSTEKSQLAAEYESLQELKHN